MHLDSPENANIGGCLSTLRHHCVPEKFDTPFEEARRVRVKKIASGLQKVAEQVQRIQEFANRTDNEELLKLLAEQFEFGADVP